MKQGMNSVNRYLWDVLLYACMGCFSYFFLVHYADIPVRLQYGAQNETYIED